MSPGGLVNRLGSKIYSTAAGSLQAQAAQPAVQLKCRTSGASAGHGSRVIDKPQNKLAAAVVHFILLKLALNTMPELRTA